MKTAKMPIAVGLAGGAAIVAFAACARDRSGPAPAPHRVDASPPTTAAPAASGVPNLGRDGALVEGRVIFEGMITASKGGHRVRGVEVDEDELRPRVAASVDGGPADPAWFIGAVVRVTGELRRHQVDSAVGPDGLVEQTRLGTWFSVAKIERVELVARAEVIEGTLRTSKGLYALGRHLVRRDDIAWAARGAGPGDRVRLWGQPRTVVCEPEAQCLITGELPMFDVARGERLP